MTPISTFRKHIAVAAKGCPNALLDRGVVFAARDFCGITHAWRADAESLRARDGVATYDLDTPSCAEIVTANYVTYDGREIFPLTESDLSASSTTWRTDEGGPIGYYLDIDEKTIRVYRIPDETGLRIGYRLILKPSADADELPDFLLSQHLEAMIDGALSHVLQDADGPWYKPEKANEHAAKFEARKANARDRVMRNYTTMSLRVKPRRFA